MLKIKPNTMRKIKFKVLLLAIFVLGVSACAQKTCPTYTKDTVKPCSLGVKQCPEVGYCSHYEKNDKT